MFCKKGVLRNFAKFTGKHLCQSLFFNKVAGLRPGTLLKKILWHRCFLVNFTKFLRTPFLTEHLGWLLLFLFVKATTLQLFSLRVISTSYQRYYKKPRKPYIISLLIHITSILYIAILLLHASS